MLIVELWWLAYLQAMGSSETVVAYIFASRGSQSVKRFLSMEILSKKLETTSNKIYIFHKLNLKNITNILHANRGCNLLTYLK